MPTGNATTTPVSVPLIRCKEIIVRNLGDTNRLYVQIPGLHIGNDKDIVPAGQSQPYGNYVNSIDSVTVSSDTGTTEYSISETLKS